MKTATISSFRKSIKSYIDSVVADNEPVLINRGEQGVVLVSLEEYNSLARTAAVLNSSLVGEVLKSAKEQKFVEVDIDSL